MNAKALPLDHWVAVRLGGRAGWAHHGDPVVKHMRRLTAAREARKPPREADVEAVRAWLDAR